MKLRIANLVIEVNASDKLLHESFFDFEEKDKSARADMIWNVSFKEDVDYSEYGVLVNCKDLCIYGNSLSDTIIYRYLTSNEVIDSFEFRSNGAQCVINIVPAIKEKLDKDKELLEIVKICIYNIFREIFILACTSRDRIPIHSSSIVYNDKAYLFSAASGVGKSTHTELWVKRYGVKILDGDVAMCYISQDGSNRVTAYGMPWCGTSNQYMNEGYELGGVVFLVRAKHNEIHQLSDTDTAAGIFNNHFIPYINEEIVDRCVKMIEEVTYRTSGYVLKCLPDYDAVDTVKNYIT